MAIGNILNPIEAINAIKDLDTNKYNKTGGEISGDVKVDGNFTLYIADDDYDAGINFTRALDDNLGTVLTLTGYADNTNYKPIIRNIGTCVNDYDIANKKYVDDLIFYIPISSLDVTTITWNDLYEAYTNNHLIVAKIDYLNNGSTVPVIVPLYSIVGNQSAGSIVFTFLIGISTITYIVTGIGSNVCTVTKQEQNFELISNKTQAIALNSTSTTLYPSTKAVFDEFQRKPVVVWESNDPSTYLKGIQTDISASPAWQLTNLDLTPFKRIKIYSCAGQKSGTTASASTTAAMILEMSLDSRAAISAYGGNYVGSIINQKPNDNNRLATLTCAVSADKTSFVVLRQTNLYGTGVTSNNDVNANVFMIEGYYD